jgi:hypothetical protein
MSGQNKIGFAATAIGFTFTVFAMVAFAAFGAMLARWLV